MIKTGIPRKISSVVLLFIFILYTSCIKSKDKSITTKLEGNWYSIKNNTYLEYYIKDSIINVYFINADYLYYYDFYIENDSIFNRFESKSKSDNYEFYNKLIKMGKDTLHLTHRKLIKLQGNNTLKDLLEKKINKDQYILSCLQREEALLN